MKRILRWLGIGLGGLAGLALSAAALIYLRAEYVTRRTYDTRPSSYAVPRESLDTAEGRRLAAIRGCYDGCHGRGLDGGVFVDEPLLARLVAPNLTRVAARYTDAELELVIRHGIRPDGKSTLGMPSSMFYHLSDRDLGRIVAFIRSTPPTEGPETEIVLGPLARLGIALGKYQPQAAMIDHEAPRVDPGDGSDPLALGRYMALTSCTECHGGDLRGSADQSTPDLAIAGAYSNEAFIRLMRTGIAMGERELRLMSSVARTRFAHMTDSEIRALHAYLRTLRGVPAREESM